jgi:DNA-directed RNA polymerase subunit M/transcription elongation factor TFIIS
MADMAFEFRCENCGNKIVAKYLRKGEIAVCQSCGTRNRVPDSAEDVSEPRTAVEPKVSEPTGEEKYLLEIKPQNIQPIETAAKAANFFIWFSLLLFAANIVLNFILIGIMEEYKIRETSYLADQYMTYERWANTVFILSIGETLAGTITFFWWFYRAHKNLRRARVPTLKHASGWTIGGFFVPFLNLVRPLTMMKETWKGSVVMSSIRDPEDIPFIKPGPKPGVWWGFFLGSRFFAMRAGIKFRIAEEIDEFITATYYDIAASALTIISGIALILTIREITRNQTEAKEKAYKEMMGMH